MQNYHMKDLANENPKLADELMAIMASGNELDEQNKKNEAQALYQKAWDLLPEPKLEWTPLSHDQAIALRLSGADISPLVGRFVAC